MSLFKKLLNVAEESSSRKIKTTKSLKAIMKAIDFNVFRYRTKTWVIVTWTRGWKVEQRKLQDSIVISLPEGYKLYALNIPQFIQKLNWEYLEIKEWQNWEKQILNILSSTNITEKQLPTEIQKDINFKKWNLWIFSVGPSKIWYIAWIEQNWTIIPLKRKQFDAITVKNSWSSKSIYRDKRDWNFEDSFIKQVWMLVASVVVDKNWKPLIEKDIEPKDYKPKKENSEKEVKSTTEIVSNNLDDIDFKVPELNFFEIYPLNPEKLFNVIDDQEEVYDKNFKDIHYFFSIEKNDIVKYDENDKNFTFPVFWVKKYFFHDDSKIHLDEIVERKDFLFKNVISKQMLEKWLKINWIFFEVDWITKKWLKECKIKNFQK